SSRHSMSGPPSLRSPKMRRRGHAREPDRDHERSHGHRADKGGHSRPLEKRENPAPDRARDASPSVIEEEVERPRLRLPGLGARPTQLDATEWPPKKPTVTT